MSEPLADSPRYNIGQVLSVLAPDFPGLALSKLRYLEKHGIVNPHRTASNYRKYSAEDIERLRFALRVQKERYWSIAHIRKALDDMDRGAVPTIDVGQGIRVPDVSLAPDGLPDESTFALHRTSAQLTRDDILEAAHIESETLDAIEEFGLIKRRPNQRYYDADALMIASLVGQMGELGLEPRHLRGFRAAADRELSLFEQAVPTAARKHENAQSTLAALAALAVRLHAVLVRSGLRG